MRNLLLFLWFILAGTLHSQELRIYFNSNDCINCTSAISQLSVLDSAIAVEVQCDEAKRNFLPALLERYGVRPSERIAVDYVPTKVILRQAPVGSTCEFRLQDRVLFHFPLKELGAYVPALQRSAHRYDHVRKLPFGPGHLLSDRVQVFPAGDGALLYDYLFRSLDRFTPIGPDAGRLVPFAPDDTLTRQLMGPHVISLAQSDSLAPYMDTKVPFEHDLKAVNDLGGTLQLIDHIHYAQWEPDRSSVTLKEQPFYLTWSDGRFTPVGWTNWVDILPHIIVHEFGFYMDPSTLITSLIKIEPDDKPWYLIAKWDRVGDSLAFHGFGQLTCPEALRRYGPESPVIEGSMREGLYTITNYPLVYDVLSERSYDLTRILPGRNAKGYFDQRTCLYTALDLLPVTRGSVLLLYQFKGRTELALIDLAAMKVIHSTPIDTHEVYTTALRIRNDGRLIGLGKANDAMWVIE